MLKGESVGLAKFGEGESRTARIFARLRNDIMTGRLEPGRKLKIEDLRRMYDSGTSTLREALGTMCADGLVERLDQRGFRVADVSVIAFDEFLVRLARLCIWRSFETPLEWIRWRYLT